VSESRLIVEDLREPPPGFLSGDLGGEALHRAFGAAGIENFEVGYLRVWRDASPVAVAPYQRYMALASFEDAVGD